MLQKSAAVHRRVIQGKRIRNDVWCGYEDIAAQSRHETFSFAECGSSRFFSVEEHEDLEMPDGG